MAFRVGTAGLSFWAGISSHCARRWIFGRRSRSFPFRLGGHADKIYGLSVFVLLFQPPISLICSVCPCAFCSQDYLSAPLSALISCKLATLPSIPTGPVLCFQNIPTGQRASLTFTCFFLVYSSVCYPSCASVSTTVKTPRLYTHTCNTHRHPSVLSLVNSQDFFRPAPKPHVIRLIGIKASANS